MVQFRTKKRADGSSFVHPVASGSGIRKGKKTLGKNRFKVEVKNAKPVEAKVPETEDKEETEQVESTSDVVEQEDNAEGNDVEQKEATKVEAEED